MKKQNNLKKIIDFVHQAGRLKQTFRFSEEPKMPKESVADHCWRLALMVFVFADELKLKIDLVKAIKIALVHDIAECVTGDIDAVLIMSGKISKAKKEEFELNALKDIKKILPPKIGSEIYNLWGEYGKGKSEEAKFVKALDRLETLSQISEAGFRCYKEFQFIPNYGDTAINNFKKLAEVLKIIKKEIKKEFDKGGTLWKKEYSAFIK